jgi:hypothetical protein
MSMEDPLTKTRDKFVIEIRKENRHKIFLKRRGITTL